MGLLSVQDREYSWPSFLACFTSVDSTNCKSKVFGKKHYAVAGMYFVVRPIVVETVLNIYRYFVVIPETM